MPRVLDPFRFVLICVPGWMNQRQLQVIDYLREENRVLRLRRLTFPARPECPDDMLLSRVLGCGLPVDARPNAVPDQDGAVFERGFRYSLNVPV